MNWVNHDRAPAFPSLRKGNMRFPENRIREAILHPDVEIRERAVNYFAKAFDPDPTLMPLVIQAVQTYGRDDASRLIGQADDLRQSEETTAWVLGELND